MANRHILLPQLCVGLVVLVGVFQVCKCDGKIEIKMLEFKMSCSDNFFQDCDTYFKFCIGKKRNPDDGNCDYLRKTSGHWHNDNHMTFGSDMKGVDNPLVTSFDQNDFQSGGLEDVRFRLKVYDKDTVSDDHEATVTTSLSYATAPSKSEAEWLAKSEKGSSSSQMWFEYRFYCDKDWYTADCNVYCEARDDYLGHYTCEDDTGEKKCHTGWTGPDCTIDVDECQRDPCYHDSPCTNYDGWYNCTCPQGYAGQNCDMIDSLCHSSPCQHGGRCTGDVFGYNCTCTVPWIGDNCEIPVDFCQSNPCQNGATCYATVGNYTCACPLGFTGYHCTEEVRACDSSPCANGAECTNLPQEEYLCTCPDQYEGDNCTVLKDPCRLDPCQYSGMCTKLNFNRYACDCKFGWEGRNCEKFVGTEPEEEEEKKEKFPLLPILLSIIAVIVITVGVILLLLIRRRRRQKKEVGARLADQEDGTTVVHVVGRDNLAFPNALYDETNRANSVLEARGNNHPHQHNRPLPQPTPTCASDDPFNFTKPKKVEGDEDEHLQGAVGGCNPYQSSDVTNIQPGGKYMDMKGAEGGGMGKERPAGESNPSRLDTRTLAGGPHHYDKPSSNPYADFEDLKKAGSAAGKGTAGYANGWDCVEEEEEEEKENHYHDLNDLHIDIPTCETTPTFTFCPPVTTAASHYDAPRSVSSDGYDATVAGNDLTLPVRPPAGYMAMEGSTSRELQLENLDSTDDEEDDDEEVWEEGGIQEDIDKLRRETAMKGSATGQSDI